MCLGAHSDDIEIGCGGTILKLLDAYPGSEVAWVVFSAAGERAREAEAGARCFLGAAGSTEVAIKDFRDGYFPYAGDRLKDEFELLKVQPAPDLVFTHYRHDRHQDHRLLSDLTWNTFRDHLILEYEIPKYDGDLGAPNFFVQLPEPVCHRKVDLLMDCFATQSAKPWFDRDTFLGLMRLRGLECQAPGRFAEAFYCRKLVI